MFINILLLQATEQGIRVGRTSCPVLMQSAVKITWELSSIPREIDKVRDTKGKCRQLFGISASIWKIISWGTWPHHNRSSLQGALWSMVITVLTDTKFNWRGWFGILTLIKLKHCRATVLKRQGTLHGVFLHEIWCLLQIQRIFKSWDFFVITERESKCLSKCL